MRATAQNKPSLQIHRRMGVLSVHNASNMREISVKYTKLNHLRFITFLSVSIRLALRYSHWVYDMSLPCDWNISYVRLCNGVSSFKWLCFVYKKSQCRKESRFSTKITFSLKYEILNSFTFIWMVLERGTRKKKTKTLAFLLVGWQNYGSNLIKIGGKSNLNPFR